MWGGVVASRLGGAVSKAILLLRIAQGVVGVAETLPDRVHFLSRVSAAEILAAVAKIAT